LGGLLRGDLEVTSGLLSQLALAPLLLLVAVVTPSSLRWRRGELRMKLNDCSRWRG